MTAEEANSLRIENTLSQWFYLIDLGPKNLPDPNIPSGQSYLKIAFTWAFHYLKVGKPFTEALREILLKGGDTMANGAIVGALLGAHEGLGRIPSFLLDPVLAFRCSNSEERRQFNAEEARPDYLVPGVGGVIAPLNEIFTNAPYALTVELEGT
jgi:hypothetical protein